MAAENEDWDLKHKEGCLINEVSVKKGNYFSYLIVGLLFGYFCNVLKIKALNDGDTDKLSGKEKMPDFIFLYVYFTSLDSKGGRP